MDARGIKKGMTVWIPCEVKGGFFSKRPCLCQN